MPQSQLFVLCGPTGVGKSALGIRLAEALNAEIVSADSMQIYRGMDIGTAKPSPEEQERVPHHLIDCVDPDESFDLSQYIDRADKAIADIRDKGRMPLLVGGTGLYIEGVLYGLFEGLGTDLSLREELESQGADKLHAMLMEIDPEAAKRIPEGNKRRIVRALEICRLTGRPFSAHLSPERTPRYSFFAVGVTMPREALYQKINDRVDAMIRKGLFDEAAALFEKGISPDSTSFQGIGYRQILGFLEGKYDKEEAIRLIKRDTRRYAKRQMTWFRNRMKVRVWVSPNEFAHTLELFKEQLET